MRPLPLFVAGVALVLLLLEGVFRLLPVSTSTRTGYYFHPHILTYPAQHCFTISTGWDLRNAQRNCANNFGFLADHDFVQSPQAVALIGDSFVEANMLPPRERLAAQIETRLGGWPVYTLGGPGSNLLDYAERARFAASNFGIRTFVFVLTRVDVREALCGSGNGYGPCIDAGSLRPRVETQQSAGLLKQLFRESAVAQYVFSQLKFNFSTLASSFKQKPASETRPTRTEPPAEATGLVVRTFFAEISKIDGGRYYFVIDPDRANLFSDIPDPTELEQFRKQAKAFGAIEVDPATAFRQYLAASGLALEIGPYDKHWNREALRLIAESVAAQLTAAR